MRLKTILQNVISIWDDEVGVGSFGSSLSSRPLRHSVLVVYAPRPGQTGLV